METIRAYDKYGFEREWDITSEKCVGCCWHALHNVKIHCCPHKIKCRAKGQIEGE